MTIADVGGRKLYFERRGEGEPVLLVMGLAATVAYWGDPFLDALPAERFETIAYDHRGIGASDCEHEPFGVPDLAADALGLLDALGLDSAHVVGFSLGGMVAQEVALRRPRAVRRLVLAGTAAGGAHGAPIALDMLSRLEDAIVSGDPQRALRAGLEANVSDAAAARADVQERWKQLVSSQKLSLPTVRRQLEAVATHDAVDRLRELEAPTLVLHGAEDRMIEPRQARLLAARLPHARLELLPETGHMVFWEQPERSAALVAAWLGGDEPPADRTTDEESDDAETE